MNLGSLKQPFESWAKRHVKFNYNKSTKRLIIHGNHFEDLHEPLQQTLVISFLDQIGVTILVNPVDNPQWWTVKILMQDISAPFFIAYELPIDDESLTSRFLATQFAIQKYIEMLEDGKCS